MSTMLSMRGLRGGCGTTSLLAALGWALRALDQRVLLIDLDPAGMLGLHLGMPAGESRGWARAVLDRGDWRDQAYAVTDDLALLPYGQVDAAGIGRMETWLAARAGWWAGNVPALYDAWDWVLMDVPQGLPGHVASVAAHSSAAIAITVAAVDPACHVLLQRRPWNGLLLANRYDPARNLQRDLLRLWHRDLGARLLSQAVHEDAAVPEALALKQPVGRCMPDALAAADIGALAMWCLAHVARGEAGNAP